MTSCERCWVEAQRRGIEYREMLRIAERENHICTHPSKEGAKAQAGEYWDEATQSDRRWLASATKSKT